jgi:mono/diheme cytochrome c family protein
MRRFPVGVAGCERVAWGVIAVAMAFAASLAQAELNASYEGHLTLVRPATDASVAAVLRQTGITVTGTIAMDFPDATSGVFWITGRARGRHLVLAGGNTTGVRLRWRGRQVDATTLRGRARITGAGVHRHGLLALAQTTEGPPPPPGATCDNSYFTDQVMAQVLVPICSRCHVAGGLAEAARFRVTVGDPLTTQQSVAAMIDTVHPDASRILEKPLGVLPHGGGQQITAGSAEEQILRHWIDLVAQGVCSGSGGGNGGNGDGGNGSGGPVTGADLYDANCAACHGADARGLAGRPNIRCASAIHDTVRNSRGTAMPAFSNLADADIALIQTYLAGLCSASGATGADLYAGNCASCHGTDGGGGRNAAGVRGPNIHCKDTGEFLEKVRHGEDRMPAFPGLSDAEIQSIASYVQGFCAGSVGGD